jgi:hypothetical protein
MRQTRIERYTWVFYLGFAFCIISALFGVWSVTWPAIEATQSGQPLPGSWTWPLIILADVVMIGIFGTLFLILLAQASVILSDEGISQWRLFRRVFVRWSDVQALEITSGNMRFVTSNNRIELATYQFKDPDVLIDFIRTHLPDTLTGKSRVPTNE